MENLGSSITNNPKNNKIHRILNLINKGAIRDRKVAINMDRIHSNLINRIKENILKIKELTNNNSSIQLVGQVKVQGHTNTK